MFAVCTTCSAEKRTDPGLLPACERYTHPRIGWVRREAERLDAPVYILSGVYGLVGADADLPWYDHALQADEVAALVPQVAGALTTAGVDRLLAYVEPDDTPGWGPYLALLRGACDRAGVALETKRPGA